MRKKTGTAVGQGGRLKGLPVRKAEAVTGGRRKSAAALNIETARAQIQSSKQEADERLQAARS